jgi:diketogulonate reductase-like aldo/keto reductase
MLQAVYAEATIKPSFLQNRFYRESGYDREIRAFCAEHSIKYQSFWTLSANPMIIKR